MNGAPFLERLRARPEFADALPMASQAPGLSHPDGQPEGDAPCAAADGNSATPAVQTPAQPDAANGRQRPASFVRAEALALLQTLLVVRDSKGDSDRLLSASAVQVVLRALTDEVAAEWDEDPAAAEDEGDLLMSAKAVLEAAEAVAWVRVTSDSPDAPLPAHLWETIRVAAGLLQAADLGNRCRTPAPEAEREPGETPPGQPPAQPHAATGTAQPASWGRAGALALLQTLLAIWDAREDYGGVLLSGTVYGVLRTVTDRVLADWIDDPATLARKGMLLLYAYNVVDAASIAVRSGFSFVPPEAPLPEPVWATIRVAARMLQAADPDKTPHGQSPAHVGGLQ